VEHRTRYAKSGDVHVAYQVLGDGPDLVLLPGWISHVEACWELPALAGFLERLASFTRLILIDKRGTGLSDPLPRGQVATLEERMDDIRAVLDAVGSTRAALFGVSEGGPLNILFAATYPERTSALVLFGSFARLAADEGYPHGTERTTLHTFAAHMRDHWGTGVGLRALAPSAGDDPVARDAWGRYQRISASPSVAAALLELNADIDVRQVLPTIRVPTLVLHRHERFVSPELGRYVAYHVPHARFMMLPGEDHLFFHGDTDDITAEIEEFLIGTRSRAVPDRVLATVLFTDIVGSTKQAVHLGDRRWREVLTRHDALVRRQLARHRGREVKTTGDGFLAVFDGPARALRCAEAISVGVEPLGIAVRAGLHCGECEVRGDDVGGIAVHIASRVADLAGAGEVLCTGTVKDLVAGSGLSFVGRGTQKLRGIPEPWAVFSAT
jgi:class 3 adenylate cyclase